MAPLRYELVAEARATVRFETRPGEQLQIDFGERSVEIAGVRVKVFLFRPSAIRGRRMCGSIADLAAGCQRSLICVPAERAGVRQRDCGKADCGGARDRYTRSSVGEVIVKKGRVTGFRV